MIFVTVGTHEQQFNRLVEYIDNLKRDGIIEEDVIIQTGYCTYTPKYCSWQKLYKYNEMIQLVNDARIVITHGGPSSFIMPLKIGKTPIVVPRKKEFDEHVNNHQLEFVKEVSKRHGTIIDVEDIKDLKDIIISYDSIINNKDSKVINNNEQFCEDLEQIVYELF